MSQQTFKLTPTEAQQKWVEALRSGEYQQVTRGLCVLGDDGQPSGYCCLGVACELYQQYEGGLDIADDGVRRLYDNRPAFTPRRVQEWLGLAESFAGYRGGGLIRQNDCGASFAEIADIIESRPSGLFVD